jgi:Protein of unknown function (DUF1579)
VPAALAGGIPGKESVMEMPKPAAGHYEQERGGVITFAGHGVMGFDPSREIYTLHWFDSMGSPPERFEGRFAGDVLTVAHGGPGMHARLTWDVSQPDRMRTKMEMSQDGTVWNTLFDAHYTRAQAL